MAEASGFEPDPLRRFGPVRVDPAPVLATCEAVGDRLALACRRGESMILATGHPTGLPLLYIEVGRELVKRGVDVLTPFEATPWQEGGRGRREIRYFHRVAMLVGHGSTLLVTSNANRTSPVQRGKWILENLLGAPPPLPPPNVPNCSLHEDAIDA